MKKNKELIVEILNKFPEVVWDRFEGEVEDVFACFGWISREDYKFDFIDITFNKGKAVTYSTSSAKHSEDFNKRLGFENYLPCQRMENLFDNIKTIKQNSEKSDKMISIPVTYLHDKFNRIGNFVFEKQWYERITPSHQFLIGGRFKNDGVFKVMEITLVRNN